MHCKFCGMCLSPQSFDNVFPSTFCCFCFSPISYCCNQQKCSEDFICSSQSRDWNTLLVWTCCWATPSELHQRLRQGQLHGFTSSDHNITEIRRSGNLKMQNPKIWNLKTWRPEDPKIRESGDPKSGCPEIRRSKIQRYGNLKIRRKSGNPKIRKSENPEIRRSELDVINPSWKKAGELLNEQTSPRKSY